MATAAVSPFASLLCSKCRKEIASSSSRSRIYTLSPQLGSASFSAWSGLKQLGSISFERSGKERRGRCKGRMVIRASLFGVGAPEALVIGVAALLVFGPKGLAEVARTLGKTLRAFQPTIRELQDVSREFKSTLENEIGLDEVGFSLKNTYAPGNLADQGLSTSANSSIMEAVLPPTSSEVSATSTSGDATTESPAASALTPTVSETTDTNASQKASAKSALNL